MKPSAKFNWPAALLLFLTAACLFYAIELARESAIVVVGLFTGYHPQRFSAWAVLGSDGKLKYLAYNQPGYGRTVQYWELDETLQSRKEIPPPSHEKDEHDIFLSGDSVPRSARYYEQIILPITYKEVGSDPSSELLELFPLVWWDGPKGCFDIYSRLTRRRIGSVGGDGAVINAPEWPAARFQPFMIRDGIAYGSFIATENGVYWLDLPRGPLHRIFEGPVQAAATFTLSNPSEGWIRSYNSPVLPAEIGVFVESGGELLWMNAQGSIARRIPLPPETRGLAELTVTFFGNDRVRIGALDPSFGPVRKLWLLSPEGQVLRRVEYNPADVDRRLNAGAVYPPPLNGSTILPPLPMWMAPATLAQSVILSLLLAGGALWHQLRIGRGAIRCAAWTFFVFLFGLIGAAAYLVAYRDFRSVPCPECRKRRPLSEDACPHCRATWPAPKPLGIELRTAEGRA